MYVEVFKVLNFVAISVLWTRGLRGAEVNDDWSRFLTILTLTRSDLGGDGSGGSGPGRGRSSQHLGSARDPRSGCIQQLGARCRGQWRKRCGPRSFRSWRRCVLSCPGHDDSSSGCPRRQAVHAPSDRGTTWQVEATAQVFAGSGVEPPVGISGEAH